MFAGSIMGEGERKGSVKGVFMSAGGPPAVCGGGGKPYSDGEVVAVDMGKGRKSIPKLGAVSMRRFWAGGPGAG